MVNTTTMAEIGLPAEKGERSIVSFLLGLFAALALAGSAAAKWWHSIGVAPPSYEIAFRATAAFLCFWTLYALFDKANRAAIFFASGVVAFCLPVLLLISIYAFDPPSMYAAENEYVSSDYLIKGIMHMDANPQIAWSPYRRAQFYRIKRDEFTAVESLEITGNFVKEGWYICFIGAILLLCAGVIDDKDKVRRLASGKRVPLALLLIALYMLFFGRSLMGFLYWSAARSASARDQYGAALADYQAAIRWDPRLDYDIATHFDLGRLYGYLGMYDQPDYWAAIGDSYAANWDFGNALHAYKQHVPDPTVNPTILNRYVNLLVSDGTVDSDAGRNGAAATKWGLAHELDPHNLLVSYALAMAYSKLGRYEDCIALCHTIVDQNEDVNLYRMKYFIAHVYFKPITARAWSTMGWCYYKLNRYQDAIACDENARQDVGGGGDVSDE